jgi:sulfite exporter TauE/SafE
MTYHLGRLTAYATIGLVFGLVGKGFFMAGLQQKMSIFIGIAMITIVLIQEKKIAKFNFSQPIFRFLSKIKQQLGSQFKTKATNHFYNRFTQWFLPCGMVYVALFTP